MDINDLDEEHKFRLREANANRRKKYYYICETHGVSLFSVHTWKCIKCYDIYGMRRDNPSQLELRPPGRPAINQARADARRAGFPSYDSVCPVHGQGPFSTARGLCLQCYSALGAPRPRSTNPVGFYLDRNGEVVPCRE